jgi:fructose-1,6-bisphosphatase/inositol monophosphatase family enzyme
LLFTKKTLIEFYGRAVERRSKTEIQTKSSPSDLVTSADKRRENYIVKKVKRVSNFYSFMLHL